MTPAFFEVTDAGLFPRPHARAPWAPDMLHGRLLAGLAAWAIERDHGDADFVPVRLTVDLYKSPTMERTAIETQLVRSGGRVRAIDARITVGGADVARASTLWLRRSRAPEGDDAIPSTGPWDASPPVDDASAALPADVDFDVRVAGERGFGAPGPEPRRAWLRDRTLLVDDVALTPFVRVALCADFASPFANSGPNGLDYINADLTLHLGRLPGGEWIGLETDDRVALDGVSVAQCVYHDADGPIGWSSVSAVVTAPMPRPPQE